MIVKSLTWKVKGFAHLLDYVARDLIENDLIGYVGKEGEERHGILHNLRRSDDLKGITRQFAEQDAYRKRRKNGVTMYHEILSFHPSDRAAITPVILEDITREYLRLRAPRALAYAAPHFDRDHVHIHIAISGTEFRSSKTIRMDKRTFDRVKRQLQAYQRRKYPELEHSVVHFRDRASSKEPQSEMELEPLVEEALYGHAESPDGQQMEPPVMALEPPADASGRVDQARRDLEDPIVQRVNRFFFNLDLSRMSDDQLRRKHQALEKLRDSRAVIGLRPHPGLDHLIEDAEHIRGMVGPDAYQQRLEELEAIQEARALRDRVEQEHPLHEVPPGELRLQEQASVSMSKIGAGELTEKRRRMEELAELRRAEQERLQLELGRDDHSER